MTEDELRAREREFHTVVNMKPAALRAWLETPESREVGWKGEGEHGESGHGEGESVGHESGRRIVELLGKKRSEVTDDDRHFMARVVSYVHRHLAQGGPAADKEHSRWRYSLMNWGHDPCD